MSDGTRFDGTLDLPMVDHLDSTNFREGNTIIMGGCLGGRDNAETGLREGEAIVSAFSLEARIARLLGMFSDATKKALKCQLNPFGHILQDLGMHIFQRRTLRIAPCLEGPDSYPHFTNEFCEMAYQAKSYGR